MRIYARRDEERVRMQSRVRDWTRAGLLNAEQAAHMATDLETPLRRAGLMLRLGLVLFTCIVVIAAVALVLVVLEPGDGVMAAWVWLSCLITFALANWLAGRLHFYRHGVEEALAISTVALAGIGTGVVADLSGALEAPVFAMALTVAAVAGALCYIRFGFQYAAVGAMVLAAAVPVPLDNMSAEFKRVVAAGICAVVFVTARRFTRRREITKSASTKDEFGPNGQIGNRPSSFQAALQSEIVEDDATMVAAAGLAGVYLALNLQIGPAGFGVGDTARNTWFWWTTYALVWAIPALGLWRGIRERDRVLLRVSLVLALITFITNKPYLGWARQTWDPMILGVLLIGGAVAMRRWLAAGVDGQRGGFSPARLLPSEDAAINVAGLASAGIHMQPNQPAPAPPAFGGGRSGGGGTSGMY